MLSLCLRGSVLSLALVSASGDFLSQYTGTPFHDSRYAGGAQKIPGLVQCAYYDLGGECVAYHDTTAKNEGSGGLNPADGTYLNEFRMGEAVDTSTAHLGFRCVVREQGQLAAGLMPGGPSE